MPAFPAPHVRRRIALAGAAVVLGTGLAACGFTVRKSSGPQLFGPEVSAPAGEKLQLSITGSRETLHTETSTVRFNTTDGSPALDTVYYFLEAAGPQTYFQQLRDGAENCGIDSIAVENWIAAIQRDPARDDNYALPPGNDLGFSVVYDLRYDGSRQRLKIIVSVSATQ